jgi:hypothetical protein
VPGSPCVELIVDRLAPGQREALNQCLEIYDIPTCVGLRETPERQQLDVLNECLKVYDLPTCVGLRETPVMRDGTPVP